jgi:hypothetical protein
MATSPQPPRAPAAPQPPKSSSNFLAIALLLLALIVVLGAIGVFVGVHVLTHTVHVELNEKGGGKDAVSIKTPLGSLEVNQKLNEVSLGLPIYPGSVPIKPEDSATVNLDIANEAKVRILAGKFETADSLEKVASFYHQRLDNEVTKFKEKNDEGKTVFEIKHDKLDKVVALKNDGNKTVIELVHVSEGEREQEAN